MKNERRVCPKLLKVILTEGDHLIGRCFSCPLKNNRGLIVFLKQAARESAPRTFDRLSRYRGTDHPAEAGIQDQSPGVRSTISPVHPSAFLALFLAVYFLTNPGQVS